MPSFKISATYVLSILQIVGLLFFAPIVPTSTLFAWSSVSKGDSRNQSNLTAADLDSVQRLIKAHKMYGPSEGIPTSVSLEHLLSGRERFGILEIRDMDAGKQERCPECSLVVNTGLRCGGLCGGGTEFYLLQRAGQWEIREFVLWTS